MWKLKKNKWASITKQQSHRCRQQTSGCQRGEGWGEERSRWGRVRSTDSQVQNKWITGMKCTVWEQTQQLWKKSYSKWLENLLDMISFFSHLGLLGGPACDLSWRMSHVPLRRMCVLLLSDGMFCKYQLNSSSLTCHLRPGGEGDY